MRQAAMRGFIGVSVSAFCLCAAMVGCAENNKQEGMSMSSDKEQALIKADAIISTGEREIEDGQSMQAKDPDNASKLIQQGESDKARGEQMKAQAAQMKD